MTRALVLFAHPCPESFSSALHERVVETLRARGWEVDDCDLNAEAFNPVMSEAERRHYHETAVNRAAVQPYIDRLLAADTLVLVFPVWNFGFPAILKGFFDRVFLPGVSFTLTDGKLAPALTNIRKLVAVTTYGTTRFRAFLGGDPPRRIVRRALAHVTQTSRPRYLALYNMNRATDAHRAAFLTRITRAMETL